MVRKRLRRSERRLAEAYSLARMLASSPSQIALVQKRVEKVATEIQIGDPQFPAELFSITCLQPFPPKTMREHKETK